MNGDALTAIFTGAMAGVTAWMAWNTGRALKQNNDLRNDANLHYKLTREQDQQHHEDQFRPVLILAPPAGVGATLRGNLVSIDAMARPSQVHVHSPIRNIGSGAALNIHMFVRKNEKTGFGPSIELTPIAGGDQLDPNNHRFTLPVISEIFNDADLHGLPGGAWTIVLEYEDIFRNPFHTLHYKDAQRTWAKPGRGPAPDTTPTLLGSAK